MPLVYPKVADANGALIDFQGIQKVRTYQMPAQSIVQLNTTGTAFNATARGFYADVAGTATIVDASGNTITGFPITAGYNNLAITKISSLSGTTKVWGAY